MKNIAIAAGILLALGLSLSSCESTTGSVAKTGWAEYTVVPSKNYTVVGAIVIRGIGFKTLNADLMDQAIKMGAHDIINVRIDYEPSTNGPRILAATAIAIKYNDQTLTDKTATPAAGAAMSGETIIRNTSTGGIFSNDSSNKKKKFLGVF
jgi:hypothetical protein